MKRTVAIGIDLGGTNLKVAAVDRRGHIAAHRLVPVEERGPDAVITDMVSAVNAALNEIGATGSDMIGVGVGAPGPMDLAQGRILKAANLPEWENVTIRDTLASRLQTQVVFDNDGNAAAFGEYWVGAGQGSGDLVMLTLGTGVGGGVVLDGRVLHGHFDNAAELGHTIIVAKGLPCACGQHGCLEQYCSASAVARRVEAAMQSGEPSSLAGKRERGPIDAEDVEAGVRGGDALCRRIWDELCHYLAVACVNIQHIYNPKTIVLGGGLANAGDLLLNGVQASYHQQRWALCEDSPTIVLATLGYDAGVIGAAGLAWKAAGLS